MGYIKAGILWLWAHVDNQHTIVIAALTSVLVLSLLVLGFFKLEIIGDKTAFDIYHEHTASPVIQAHKMAGGLNDMLLASNEKDDIARQIIEVRILEMHHEGLFFSAVNEQGNYKSDSHKRRYVTREQELKELRGKLEKKLERLEKQYQDHRQMVAAIINL